MNRTETLSTDTLTITPTCVGMNRTRSATRSGKKYYPHMRGDELTFTKCLLAELKLCSLADKPTNGEFIALVADKLMMERSA